MMLKMYQRRNSSEDFTKYVEPEMQEICKSASEDNCSKVIDVKGTSSSRRKNSKPEKKTEKLQYFLGTLQNIQGIKQEPTTVLVPKKHPQQTEYYETDTRYETVTHGKCKKMDTMIEEYNSPIEDKQEMKYESEEMEWQEKRDYVQSCCSNCLTLKREVRKLKAELQQLKRESIPVPSKDVLDYFQAVIDTVNGKLTGNTIHKEEHHPTILDTLCPSPPQQQVQLVKDCPVFLESNVLLECMSSSREDPLQLLRNLIRSTFTQTQLIDAGGLGLRRGHSTKPPLDPTVCQTLKTYIMNWCYKIGKNVPKERDLNRCFADTITYARKQASRKEKQIERVAFTESNNNFQNVCNLTQTNQNDCTL